LERSGRTGGGGLEVWDFGDQTLLPGLIDCHNHLSLDPTLDNYLYRMNDPLPELTIRAVSSMKVDLMAGVTTSAAWGTRAFWISPAARHWRRGPSSGHGCWWPPAASVRLTAMDL